MGDSRLAARLTDMHECPEHVGGLVMQSSLNVLIGSLPAARLGDMGLCLGPDDTSIEGSARVLINGRTAVRIGDMTAHGGVIVGGYPKVLIGGGTSFTGTPCAKQVAEAGAPFYAGVGGLG